MRGRLCDPRGMCGSSRRQVLLAGAAIPLLAGLPRAVPAVTLGGVEVQPRSAWGADLMPKGPLGQEAAGDVRFLLVHHTASSNSYAEAGVAGLLRGFYGFHTGEKGWPDIAYNFLVDRFGRVWEGRTGSLDAPVKVDATGGSQGFAQLACFIGDHTTEPPTGPALDAMGKLLGALAVRYGIDVRPGATAAFTSRGSSRHPAGTEVTTPTIAGHRDMSLTSCPGNACYPLISSRLIPAAAAAAAPRPPVLEVFSFGLAPDLGSTVGTPLTAALVGMAATPSGRGYWLVAADGGVFAFGDAGFFGSGGALRLVRPVVGMAVTPSGGGYWLVAADGGVFAFGDAGHLGSASGLTPASPVVGVAASPSGLGYRLVAADGGLFAFGDAAYLGRPDPALLRGGRAVGIAARAAGGYWVVASR